MDFTDTFCCLGVCLCLSPAATSAEQRLLLAWCVPTSADSLLLKGFTHLWDVRASGGAVVGLTMALTTLPMYAGSSRREQSLFWSLRNLGFVSSSLRQMDKISSSNWCRAGRKGV